MKPSKTWTTSKIQKLFKILKIVKHLGNLQHSNKSSKILDIFKQSKTCSNHQRIFKQIKDFSNQIRIFAPPPRRLGAYFWRLSFRPVRPSHPVRPYIVRPVRLSSTPRPSVRSVRRPRPSVRPVRRADRNPIVSRGCPSRQFQSRARSRNTKHLLERTWVRWPVGMITIT